MGPLGEFRRQPYISKHISEHIEAKNQNPKIPSCCFSQTYNLKQKLVIDTKDYSVNRLSLMNRTELSIPNQDPIIVSKSKDFSAVC